MRARFVWILALALAFSLGACSKKKKEPQAKAQLTEVALPSVTGLPESVVGYFLMANPTALLSDLEKLGGKVSPVPPGTLQAMVVQSLIQAGLKDTSVVDLKAPAGFLILNPKVHPEPAVFACQVQGEDKLLESLQPAWKHKGAPKGIHEITREEVDTYEVFKGDSPTPPSKVTRSVFLKFSGKTMLVAAKREVLELGAPLLEERLKTAPAQGAIGALLVNNLRQAFKAELDAIPKDFGEVLKPELAQSGMQDTESLAWMFDWILKKMLAFVQQTREISFSLAVTEAGAIGTLGIAPEKDSFFAKFLAEQKHAPLKLAGALPQGHFMAMAFNIQWHAFKQDLVEFTKEIMKVFFKSELSDEFLAAILEMWEVIGDEVAVSENIDADGFSIVEIFSVKDEKRAEQAMSKVMKLTSKLLADSEGVMGMKFSFEGPKEIGSHAGVRMQSMSMKWDLSSMPAMQADMLKRFYGEQMNMIMAIFDGQFALTIGKKAEQDMQELIERVKKKKPGLVSSESFQNAAGGPASESGGFFYMSIAQLVVTSLESTYAMMGQKPPEIKLPSPGSGLFMGFKSKPDQVSIALRLPAEHLTEIGRVIQALMQASSGQGY